MVETPEHESRREQLPPHLRQVIDVAPRGLGRHFVKAANPHETVQPICQDIARDANTISPLTEVSNATKGGGYDQQ